MPQRPVRIAQISDLHIKRPGALAYGRVDLFGRALEGVLAAMAPSPAAFIRDFDARRDGARFASFIYRFNRPRDVVAFCVASRDLLARHGTRGVLRGAARFSASRPHILCHSRR